MSFLQQVSSQQRLSRRFIAKNLAFALFTLVDVVVASTSCRPGLSFARRDWNLLKRAQTVPPVRLAHLDKRDSIGLGLNS